MRNGWLGAAETITTIRGEFRRQANRPAQAAVAVGLDIGSGAGSSCLFEGRAGQSSL